MKNKIPTNRNFGITFAIIFFCIFLIILFKNNNINLVLLFLTIIFFIFGIFNSKFLQPFNILWNRFGIFLRTLTTPIILIFFFILVITPIGFFVRTMKKNNYNYDDKIDTYWKNRKDGECSFDKQF